MPGGAVKKTGNVLGSVQLLHKFEERMLRLYHNAVLGWLSLKLNPQLYQTQKTQLRLHEAEFIRLHKKTERLIGRFSRYATDKSRDRARNFPQRYY